MPELTRPTLIDIRAVHEKIKPHIHQTPVMTCGALDELTGCRLFLKCENLQKVGAFKARGALNVLLSLPDDVVRRGVVTHSSGNHGAALARAASVCGIPATIVMPENSPGVKVDAVRHYGGRIVFCEPNLAAREQTAARQLDETGGVLVHPYNDYRIIAGQATAALELLEQVPSLDAVLAPVGGGGLLSGTLLSVKLQCPDMRVVGCEPTIADDAYQSWRSGELREHTGTKTIADGLRTNLGDKTFSIINELVDEIALADEENIIKAMRHIWERAKLIVEPSGAVPIAALMQGCDDLRSKRIGVILSGGNVDLAKLPF